MGTPWCQEWPNNDKNSDFSIGLELARYRGIPMRHPHQPSFCFYQHNGDGVNMVLWMLQSVLRCILLCIKMTLILQHTLSQSVTLTNCDLLTCISSLKSLRYD